MILDELLKIAEYLDFKDDIVKLNCLKKLAENNLFYITFWGHFSAGKSYLINNLLNKKLLPVHITETTALLTYISFDENEECKVIYNNGEYKSYPIDNTADIYQDSSFITDIENVNHLEISINSEILKNGLTIVDTPGINTVLTKHQNLAIDSINQAGKIFYILGGSPTNVDKKFIETINSAGIDFIFVRTKCDEIDSMEEDIVETLNKDKKLITEILNREVPFIGVSNKKENEYFSNISEVKKQLEFINDNLHNQMEESINSRLKVFQERFRKEIEERIKELKEIKSDDLSSITEKITQCNKELEKLSKQRDSNQNLLEKKLERAKNKAKNEIDEMKRNKIETFASYLEDMNYMIDESEVQKITDKRIEDFITQEQAILDFYLDEIICEEKEEIHETVNSISMESEDFPSYSEIQIQNTQFLEQYTLQLQEAKNCLELIIQEYKELTLKGETLEDEYNETVFTDALNELDEELRAIPTDMALKLSENQPIQPSTIFKMVGDAADLALLLIPGDVLVKGAKTVAETTKLGTKLAQIIHKSKKATEAVAKIAKNAKGIDKVRDSAYAVNMILKQRKYSNKDEKALANNIIDKGANKLGTQFDKYKTEKKEGTLLDKLSISYWTEKFGKQFDMPPKLEIDKEVEDERKAKRELIYKQKQQILNEKIQQRKKMNLIQNQQQELEFKEKEQKNIISLIEEEMRNEDDRLKRDAQKKAYEKYITNCKSYFSNCIEHYSYLIIEEYYKSANQNMAFFFTKNNAELTNRIEERRQYLQELIELKTNNTEEITSRMNKLDEMLAEIKEQ